MWNAASGTGSFTWFWHECCTDGLVLGPFPSSAFTMSIEVKETRDANGDLTSPKGLDALRIGSYSVVTSTITFPAEMPAKAGEIRVHGLTCNSFCSTFTNCGECNSKSAGDARCGWCSTTSTCIPEANQAATCPADFIGYNTCCGICTVIVDAFACIAEPGCGW